MLWRSGQDREDESGPGFASTVETAMASTLVRMVVAVTRWRIPLVPRETDELPFPTDRKSLWISTLDKNAVTAGGRCVN